ncbi:MAG: glycosyltransferase [Mycobacterium sp.]
MKFALACYGMRGDIEPSVVAGRELLRRGHDVRIAVPPNLVGFAEAAGLKAFPYGLDSRPLVDKQREYWTCFFRSPWKGKELERLGRQIANFVTRCWTLEATTTTLTSLADGADLLIAGLGFEQFPANVAEYFDIPMATLHFVPLRANGQVLRFLPTPVARSAMTGYERLSWSGAVKDVEAAQRRELGLPKATRPWPSRIAARGSLEIQAYEEVCFPGLAAEWAKWGDKRPFVGTLALQQATDADAEVTSWIAGGTPPIFFSFGSIPISSAADMLSMIADVCAQLGERALISSGGSDFSDVTHFRHVKVVSVVNYATIFPLCRAVVHHGGAGTVAAGLRAGVPQVILWTFFDQPIFGSAIKRLKVGAAQRFSTSTRESLIVILRRVLTPQFRTRAREVATQVSDATESASVTADLLEKFAR